MGQKLDVRLERESKCAEREIIRRLWDMPWSWYLGLILQWLPKRKAKIADEICKQQRLIAT